jgi:hypothetical protein
MASALVQMVVPGQPQMSDRRCDRLVDLEVLVHLVLLPLSRDEQRLSRGEPPALLLLLLLLVVVVLVLGTRPVVRVRRGGVQVRPMRLHFSLPPVMLCTQLSWRSQFAMVGLEQSFNPLQYYIIIVIKFK